MGHEDAFPPPRLSARCAFSQRTFTRTRSNGRDAPKAILPAKSVGLRGAGVSLSEIDLKVGRSANRRTRRFFRPERSIGVGGSAQQAKGRADVRVDSEAGHSGRNRLAGQYASAADAYDVLASAVEGFPPTQQFPELTEAQTLLAALSESDAVKNAAAMRQRRLHLQTSLGNALIWAKGYQAPETSAAFARANLRAW